MPNIKNQEKRVITNAKRTERNKAQKSALKTALKAVTTAVEANDKVAALNALNKANSLLDKSVTSNIHHKNFASREKARLAKSINKLA